MIETQFTIFYTDRIPYFSDYLITPMIEPLQELDVVSPSHLTL